MILSTLRPVARPTISLLPALLTFSLVSASPAQTSAVKLPPGTPLVMRLRENTPMRAGLPIKAELIYPIYADDKLIVPARTLLNGTVVSLRPDTSHRTHARLGGDFTPFHIPVVRFNELVLPDGAHVPIDTDASTDGAPIFRAVPPPPSKSSFLRQGFDMGLSVARSDLAQFTAPGKADRLTQWIYNRLPYHPERIEKATAWTTQATEPINVPEQPAPPPPPIVASATPPKRHFWEEPAPVTKTPDNAPGRWTIQAYLEQSLSSETAKAGEPIKATVSEPILNADGTIAIPQGSTLVGTVAKAQPARRFGRTGVLSFNFRRLTFPGDQPQNVETTLTGADTSRDLALDSEGQLKEKPKDRISVPILLALLASRPLDTDRNGGGNQRGKNAAGGAAGLGLVGTIIGLSGISPNAAAGIGYYGTALSIYDRWIARGKKVVFPRDTRIVVETVARRSAPMQTDPSRSQNPPPSNR